MPAKWEDTSSYSRDKPRVPTCWTAKFGDLAVTVLTGHTYHKGKWVMHFSPFYDAHEIGDEADMTPAQAKERALHIARAKLAPAFKALDSAVTVI